MAYAEMGTPVGSEFLLERYPFGVSSATIRSVMAELENLGLITHPHTSAGRVPTDRGYRYYVDLLMQGSRVLPNEEEAMDSLIQEKPGGPEEILDEAIRILSLLSHEVGVALVPELAHGSFRHLELILVGSQELLVVLISYEGVVRHARVELKRSAQEERLDQAQQFLNDELQGLSLAQAYAYLPTAQEEWARVGEDLFSLTQLMPLFQNEGSVILEGTRWILEAPEFRDVERMRRLMQGLERRTELAEILRKDVAADGVKVHIGSENRDTSLTDCTIIGAPYRLGGGVTGTIGIIGPTRLDYPRVTALVGRMSQVVTQIFQEMNG